METADLEEGGPSGDVLQGTGSEAAPRLALSHP